ncbi:hypothetical protein [uncultured Ilyobacter sp.]|jgi:hypothetical protein|uniref:hypothetical protein n=1 Tax=uncultured Ilyobacter sp. TaxID=544433 RepID=UPI0029BFB9B5|nr:hypothetical protein [uncultured Ilyobacter sp.]
MLIENRKIPELIRNSCEIIDNLNKKFGEITRDEEWKEEYGYLLKENEKYGLWFGMHFGVWNSFGFPLCFSINQKESNDFSKIKLILDSRGYKSHIYKYGDNYHELVVPVRKTHFKNPKIENEIGEAIEEIKEILEKNIA